MLLSPCFKELYGGSLSNVCHIGTSLCQAILKEILFSWYQVSRSSVQEYITDIFACIFYRFVFLISIKLKL